MYCIAYILRLLLFCLLCIDVFAQGPSSVLRPEIIGDLIDTFRFVPPEGGKEDFRLIRNTLYKRVEKMPVFAGCELDINPEECSKKKLIDLLYTHIRYPLEAKKLRIQGVVYAKYIVRPDGSITSPRVERGIGGGCDEEVLRFIGILPKYTPGFQDGKAVPVQITLPVKFRLMK